MGAARKTGTKKARVDIRLTEQAKQLVERAAQYSGRSVSDFIVAAATEAAFESIERFERTKLTDEKDLVMLADLLTNPPEPSDALVAAAAKHPAKN